MVSLDQHATCPNCGSSITFKFAGAQSVVCDHCGSVVSRQRGALSLQGRMAEVIEIPAPMPYQAEGEWNGEPFEVIAFLQMDRAGAPGAPWQEMLVWFYRQDRTSWVAYAQGRWYGTSEAKPPPPVPSFENLSPGGFVDLGQYGHYVVQEIAQRRVVSGKGSMSNIPKPGAVTRYADLSGQGGAFATIDYGDGTASPDVYVGRMFDPREVKLAGGMPLEPPEVEAKVHDCPNCGASLPMVSQQSERIICQYCGTASDVQAQGLQALGPAPRPPVEPYLPLGATGNFRNHDYIVAGFVVRSCMVDGIRYAWREYLLFGGEQVGYRWLMEEDGKWKFVEPVETGDVADSGNMATFQGQTYNFKQQVNARVDYVLGQFYWKVEIGEQVEATDFAGPGGTVSREKSPREVTYSFCTPVNPQELTAFGVAAPAAPSFFSS
ncbi:MAG: DUF4178 domain-containing protein, partial [Myxococcota bacterium]